MTSRTAHDRDDRVTPLTPLTIVVIIAAAILVPLLSSGAYILGTHSIRTPGPSPSPSTVRSVPCPEEDACTVDYHDGAWHVSLPTYTPTARP